ncbi:MAG TPA: ABC transporter permease [Thermomicrobiales bacterium]|jgi:ABC-type dipeptide/oligopeptide/nickel transport system permease subunit
MASEPVPLHFEDFAEERTPLRPGRGLGDRLAPLWANKLTLIGGAITLACLFVAAIGTVLLATPGFRHLYLDQDVNAALIKPFSQGRLLGTDNLGRNTAWRIAAGMAISLLIGMVVTAASMSFGLILGAVAGYFRGPVDRIISGLIDLTWGFPVILVAVIFAGMFKPGIPAVILAVSVVNWAGFARIIRAQTLSLRERAFVEAARALGVPAWKVILRHLVPNTIATSLVMASYYIAVTVIAEAGLSFIGLGAQPPTPSLGQMIANGRNYLYNDPWVAIIPGIAIALIVLGLNTLGDGLRDVFDPRLRRW